MHKELLVIARELADREPGRPKKESLARAVSTAYYALFHALADLCGRELIGAWRPWTPFRHIYRSLEHGTARRVFEAMRASRDFGTDAKRVGEAFVLLQKLRHEADYDLGYRTIRQEVHDLIDRADESIALLNHLDPGERKLLAARLIGRTRAS